MVDFLNDSDQAGLYPTFDANHPKSMSDTYKNHGMIFYDSIYGGYTGVESCGSCGCVVSNGCNCNDC